MLRIKVPLGGLGIGANGGGVETSRILIRLETKAIQMSPEIHLRLHRPDEHEISFYGQSQNRALSDYFRRWSHGFIQGKESVRVEDMMPAATVARSEHLEAKGGGLIPVFSAVGSFHFRHRMAAGPEALNVIRPRRTHAGWNPENIKIGANVSFELPGPLLLFQMQTQLFRLFWYYLSIVSKKDN